MQFNLIYFLCSPNTPVAMWFFSFFLPESAAVRTDQQSGTHWCCQLGCYTSTMRSKQWLQKVTASCSSKVQTVHVTSLGINLKKCALIAMQDRGLSPHVQHSSGQGCVSGANPYSKSSTLLFPGAGESSTSNQLAAINIINKLLSYHGYSNHHRRGLLHWKHQTSDRAQQIQDLR